jgi:SAM-dependent methyltransferase
VDPVATANAEAIEAWNGVLFDRFVAFRHLVTGTPGRHGDAAMGASPPEPGDRVLDIGCGFGDASLQMAKRVGPSGEVLGVDAAERFIEAAQLEAAEAGVQNVRFAVEDAQHMSLDGEFDYAFSRFGTMFFANPAAALRNVREALRPGGRLCMVVWRQKPDNPWLHSAELVVERYLEEPEETDEPTCGPGPFSMANADTTSGILVAAGFEEITLQRSDLPYLMGRDLDEAIELVMGLGPAGELIRLAGDDADELRPRLTAELRDAISGYAGADGVFAGSSAWIVTARAPAAT